MLIDIPFELSEFKCGCGCGLVKVQPEFLHRLLAARYIANTRFVITSGTRCLDHNRAVGGAEDSEHLYGWAADIATSSSHARWAILQALILSGFNRIGIESDFIHAGADPTKISFVIWTYTKCEDSLYSQLSP